MKSKGGEPSSREIISSLVLFHEDQMKRYIEESTTRSFNSVNIDDDQIAQISFVQRKLHPEKQPLNAEEILELVRADILAHTYEECLNEDTSRVTEASSETSVVSSVRPTTNLEGSNTAVQITKSSSENLNEEGPQPTENWANFEQKNNDLDST